MEKIRNLSLKKTILLYFVISLTAAFLLSGFTVHFAGNVPNKIWEKYIDYADYTDVFQQYGKKYEIEISRPNQSQHESFGLSSFGKCVTLWKHIRY